MKKICLPVFALVATSLIAAPAFSKPAPLMPVKYHLPIVAAKDTPNGRELDRRIAELDTRDPLRISDNVTVGQIRQPKDSYQRDWQRNKGGFGFKGEWHF